MLGTVESDSETALEALGELALLLDADGRCDEAMATIERAKAVQLGRDEPEHRAADVRRVRSSTA